MANNPVQIKAKLLDGMNTLGYQGVRAKSPPELKIYTRPPTSNDLNNGMAIGDLWVVNNVALPQPYAVYQLADKKFGLATWLQIAPSSAGAADQFMPDITDTPGIGAVPVSGLIYFIGEPTTANIVTIKDEATYPQGNVVEIRLVDDPEIVGPLTISSLDTAASGVLYTDAAGEIKASVAGLAGTQLTSAGPNLPPVWSAGGGVGTLKQLKPDAGPDVVDLAGTVNVYGAEVAGGVVNLTTDGNTANTLKIILKESLGFQATTADGTKGVVSLGGNKFLHGLGTSNTFLGTNAGDLGMTVANATDNTGIGASALTSIDGSVATKGQGNTAVGAFSSDALDDGSLNVSLGSNSLGSATTSWWSVALGAGALDQLIDGDGNVAIGAGAGHAYTTSEHDNVLISSAGELADENTIRIGTQGAGDSQQNRCFIAGIHGATIDVTAAPMFIDAFGQISDKDSAGSVGTDGQVIIAKTGGTAKFASLTAGAGISLVGGANSLTITAVGGATGGINKVHCNSGDASEDGTDTSVTIVGSGVITTTGAAHTATIGFTASTDGQVLVGATGGVPTFVSLTAGPNITLTPGPNSLTITASGGGGGGATTFNTDTVPALITAGGAINFLAGLNTNTDGATANTVKINLNKTILLPDTNAAGTEGVIYFGAAPGTAYIHNLGVNNTFMGKDAGSFAMTPATAADNVGFGSQVLAALTVGLKNTGAGVNCLQNLNSGVQNSCYGYQSGRQISSASSNTSLGFNSLSAVTGGGFNLALGANSGSSITSTDHSNIFLMNTGVASDTNTIRIGTQGSGSGQQNKAYIAGVYGVAAVLPAQMVCIDANGKLGTGTGIPAVGTIVQGSATGPVYTGSPSISGSMTIGTGATITSGNILVSSGSVNITSGNVALTSGNITLSSGVLNLPFANTAKTVGWIKVGSYASFGIDLEANLYIGKNAGYAVNSLSTRGDNVGIGTSSMAASGGGRNNVAVGYATMNGSMAGDYSVALGSGALLTNSHSYNVAVGANALASNPDEGNTAVGYNALTAIGTGARYNTAIGYSAGSGFSGLGNNYNISIGYMAGTAASADGDSNIYIGHTGVAGGMGENNKLRIGTSGTGNGQQDSTYIAGIWNASTTTGQPVYIDSSGKLGTDGGSPAFLAIQTTSINNAIGDGTTEYFFGTAAVVSDSAPLGYDLAGNWYSGNGAGTACSFTAPFSGVYQFNMCVTIGDLYAPPAPPAPVARVDPLRVRIYNASHVLQKTYTLVNPQVAYTGMTQVTLQFVTNTTMIAGEYAKFSIQLFYGSGTKTLGIDGDATNIETFIAGNMTCRTT